MGSANRWRYGQSSIFSRAVRIRPRGCLKDFRLVFHAHTCATPCSLHAPSRSPGD